jgi:hypothetical protein
MLPFFEAFQLLVHPIYPGLDSIQKAVLPCSLYAPIVFAVVI